MPLDSPRLQALTPETQAALGGRTEIHLSKLPFRVGRDSRTPIHSGWFSGRDRRETSSSENNDLYLLDYGKLKNVSREHFQILCDAQGTYVLEDRGSVCGTIVGALRIGGDRRVDRVALRNENVIIVGTERSPFAFKFLLETADNENMEDFQALIDA